MNYKAMNKWGKLCKNRGLLLIVLLMCIFAGGIPVRAASDAESKDYEEITLYVKNPGLTGFEIPADVLTSYQLTGYGAEATYEVVYGRTAVVSETGLIEPNSKTDVVEGDTVIRVFDGSRYHAVKVHVQDYALVYAKKVIEDYLAENYHEGMTGREKIEVAAAFPCRYDYGTSAADAYSMIIYGNGDCWASTDAVILLSELMGLRGWPRNGLTGGSHTNAVVDDGEGNYYIVEAGYTGKAPRKYDISKVNSFFRYTERSEDGKLVYGVSQYFGADRLDELAIPAEINGHEITRIEDSFGVYSMKVSSKVVLPETIEKIGSFAFDDFGLTEINIPDSVKSIDSTAFYKNDDLTNIRISSSQPYFTVEDGLIYNKDKTELVCGPSAVNIRIPGSVKKIDDFAFYQSRRLCTVEIEDGVESIGEMAFFNCNNMTAAVIPASVTSIGYRALHGGNGFTIYGYTGSAAETYAKENDETFVALDGKPVLTKLSIETGSYTVQVGRDWKPKVSVFPEDYSGTLCWRSSDNSVAVPGRSGIRGLKAGEVTLTCYSYENPEVSATCRLKVEEWPEVEKFEFNKKKIRIPVGGLEYLTVAVSPEGAYRGELARADVKWELEDNAYAYLENIFGDSRRCYVHGTTMGKTKIIARSADDKSIYAECEVEVYYPVSELKLDKEQLLLKAGETAKLTATVLPEYLPDRSVTYTSSDESVVTVDKDGVVTAVGDGLAEIICTANAEERDGYHRSTACKVSVGSLIRSISAEDAEVTVLVGVRNSYIWDKLSYIPENALAQGVDWESSDTGIAHIYSYDRLYYNDIADTRAGKEMMVISPVKTGDVYAIGRARDGGGATVKVLVHVVKDYVSMGEAVVAKIPDVRYTGKELTPKPVVTVNGKELVEGRDYTLYYYNNVNPGEAGVNITGKGMYLGNISAHFTIKGAALKYRAYVQKRGWLPWGKALLSTEENTHMAGTTENLRMETIQMQLGGVGGAVEYRAYCAKKGWTQWATTADTKTYAGTKGESRRVELIQLRTKGEVAKIYDLYFRAYSEKLGWLGWAGSGQKAGTQGYAYKLEAFQVYLLPKGERVSIASDRAKSFYDKTRDGKDPQ